MGFQFWPKGGLPGILHHYTETLVTFEYTSNTANKPHGLLFIGGLGDGLATTSYMSDIARALQPTQWSLFTLSLSSSYGQWGLGHLDRDTDEIAECARYILDYKATKYDNSKIVLMGHSTGSQAVLHYLHRPNPHINTPTFDPYLQHVARPALGGAIMQAPVSDREAIQWVLKEGLAGKPPSDLQLVFNRLLSIAKDSLTRDQSFDTLLPLSLTSQIYPRNTPGLLKDKLVVLISGADQSIPDWVDKEKLWQRWKNAVDHGGKDQVWDDEYSGVIPGASHALSNDDQAEPPDVSDSLQNLIPQHSSIDTFLKYWLDRRINAYLLKIHRGMKPEKELMRFACLMSQSTNPHRLWKLNAEQPASVNLQIGLVHKETIRSSDQQPFIDFASQKSYYVDPYINPAIMASYHSNLSEAAVTRAA
ncbi:hypothetical protein B7463_g12615, partial [Scytalidium lignicola]